MKHLELPLKFSELKKSIKWFDPYLIMYIVMIIFVISYPNFSMHYRYGIIIEFAVELYRWRKNDVL